MAFYLYKSKELFWTVFYSIFGCLIFDRIGRGCKFEGWVEVTQALGKISIGNNVRFRNGIDLTVPKGGELIVCDNVFLGPGVIISAHNRVEICEGALIGEYVCIHDNNHKYDQLENNAVFDVGSCRVGRHSWVGAGTKLLKNSEVGDFSTIGAGSVVTKKIPSNSIAFGVPARVVRNSVNPKVL